MTERNVIVGETTTPTMTSTFRTEGDDHASVVAPDETRSEVEQESFVAELLYCVSSYYAIVTPVSITMILSALAVVNINTDETREQGEAAYSQTYEVFELEEGNSGQNFAASVGNVSVMLSVICAMTFVIVVLYKFGCMKIFYGYMVVVTAMLLGYFTASMATVAIQKYNIHFDKFSFAYLIWNYAIVGVLAIFCNTGIPKFVTQGYLVTSSVVLAWQLSYFNDWTAWTLLVMLALYDLFAVLSPCGPLKALTQLMSRPGARPLPGLLYEASLPDGVQRSNRVARSPSQRDVDEEVSSSEQEIVSSTRQSSPAPSVRPAESSETALRETPSPIINARIPYDETLNFESQVTPMFDFSSVPRAVQLPRQRNDPSVDPSLRSTQFVTTSSEASYRRGEEQVISQESVGASASASPPVTNASRSRSGKIALALAKLYKLPVIDEEGALRRRGRWDMSDQREYTWEEIRGIEWTPEQFCAEVTVVFPERGGRIVAADIQDSNEGKKFHVYNSSDELLRTFVVNPTGKVLQVVRRATQELSKDNNAIKLGLGDFVFYSVLVSKAALYSFTAFATCMLTIISGLGATLFLLAIHGKALPALPISIFLAVITFVMTRYFVEPYVQEVLGNSLYM